MINDVNAAQQYVAQDNFAAEPVMEEASATDTGSVFVYDNANLEYNPVDAGIDNTDNSQDTDISQALEDAQNESVNNNDKLYVTSSSAEFDTEYVQSIDVVEAIAKEINKENPDDDYSDIKLDGTLGEWEQGSMGICALIATAHSADYKIDYVKDENGEPTGIYFPGVDETISFTKAELIAASKNLDIIKHDSNSSKESVDNGKIAAADEIRESEALYLRADKNTDYDNVALTVCFGKLMRDSENEEFRKIADTYKKEESKNYDDYMDGVSSEALHFAMTGKSSSSENYDYTSYCTCYNFLSYYVSVEDPFKIIDDVTLKSTDGKEFNIKKGDEYQLEWNDENQDTVKLVQKGLFGITKKEIVITREMAQSKLIYPYNTKRMDEILTNFEQNKEGNYATLNFASTKETTDNMIKASEENSSTYEYCASALLPKTDGYFERIFAQHAYAVMGYDSENKIVTLANPHDTKDDTFSLYLDDIYSFGCFSLAYSDDIYNT